MDSYETRPNTADMRVCLKCGETFASSGPGNRICAKCQHTNQSVFAYSARHAMPTPIEHTGNMGPKGMR